MSTNPKHSDYIGEIRPVVDLQYVARNMRMRTAYDPRADETHAVWQYGNHRYKATFTQMHQGLEALRRWEAEQRILAAMYLFERTQGGE